MCSPFRLEGPKTITSPKECEEALAYIRQLQWQLSQAVMEGHAGSLEALTLSREIDCYVVQVQRYWDQDRSRNLLGKAAW